ncbi:MAG: alpha/beta hydrolase [Desulfobacteraceae bacterium]|nr:alpha/beta hydrolase [Desulfobacteraceae bacterium]
MEIKKTSFMDSQTVIAGLFGSADERALLAKSGAGAGGDPGWLPLGLPAQDGVPLVCKIFQQGKEGEPDVLFFPSERDTKSDILDMAAGLGRFDMTFMAVDFRGCGESGGELSISALPHDAEAVYNVITKWRSDGSRTGPLVIMGRSIGAAVALGLAATHQEDTSCLILESAFDKTPNFLTGLGIPVDGLETDPFPNRQNMRSYTKPVLFLHSSRDEAVSITQVEWLVAESRSESTQFQIVPSPGRYGLEKATEDFYYEAIKDFIYLRMGRRPPRKKKQA